MVVIITIFEFLKFEKYIMADEKYFNQPSYCHDIVALKLSNLKRELDLMTGGNNRKSFPLNDITNQCVK